MQVQCSERVLKIIFHSNKCLFFCGKFLSAAHICFYFQSFILHEYSKKIHIKIFVDADDCEICHFFQGKKRTKLSMQNAERTLLFNREEQWKKRRDFPELCRPQEHAFAAKTIPVHRKKPEFLVWNQNKFIRVAFLKQLTVTPFGFEKLGSTNGSYQEHFTLLWEDRKKL